MCEAEQKSQILKEKRTEVEAKRDSQYTLWVSNYEYDTTHPQCSFIKSLYPEDLSFEIFRSFKDKGDMFCYNAL